MGFQELFLYLHLALHFAAGFLGAFLLSLLMWTTFLWPYGKVFPSISSRLVHKQEGRYTYLLWLAVVLFWASLSHYAIDYWIR